MVEHNQNTEETIRELEGRIENLVENQKNNRRNAVVISMTIITIGFLIAAAIFYSGGYFYDGQDISAVASVASQGFSLSGISASNVKPVNTKDHIKGSISAPVKIIEFSDLECPFCKRFHPSLQLLMDKYGASGQVAWIYRHFPLDSIHSKARKEAQATECANELGGNDAFWEYIDKLFEITPSNNRLDLNLLPQIAENIGLNRVKFTDCLSGGGEGGKYADHIEADYQDAVASGGTGTPYSIIIASNGKTFPITGAQSYTALMALVDLALNEK